MRIAVDAGTWFNGRGFGRFTRELVGAMMSHHPQHEYVLLFDREPPSGLEGTALRVPLERTVTEAATADGSRSVRDMLRFTAAAHRTAADVLFYPAIYSWFPTPLGMPSLVTIHDAISERFPRLVFPRMGSRVRWRVKVQLALWQSTRILAVSEASRADITAYLGVPRHRVDVTTEAPNAVFRMAGTGSELAARRRAVVESLGLPGDARFFCYVGGFAAHKNVPVVARAFEASTSGHWLLLVGDPESHGFQSSVEELRAAIAGCERRRDRIRFTGFLDDTLLAALYSTADALVMPSLSEGFGLPAVEAMACGTPVIASSCGSLPEVVGDGGVLLEPMDVEGFAAAMTALSQDAPHLAALRLKAAARAARFSWKRAADLAVESLERTVGRSRPVSRP